MNHPNICTIHDIGEEDGGRSSSCSYSRANAEAPHRRAANGDTNADYTRDWQLVLRCIRSGALKRHRASRHQAREHFCHQTRPAKILDFGLAKFHSLKEITAGPTATGTSGLPRHTRYWEQLRTCRQSRLPKKKRPSYRPVLVRVVSDEMATGVLPFKGDTSAEVFGALLHVAPVASGPTEPCCSTRIGTHNQQGDREEPGAALSERSRNTQRPLAPKERRRLWKKATPASKESRSGPQLELAHVLFTDIVGYSQMPMDQQGRYCNGSNRRFSARLNSPELKLETS